MASDDERSDDASRRAEALAARVVAIRDRIAPLVPDIDPGDLMLIVESMLRPFGSGRRFLLVQAAPGVHVA